MLHIILGLLLAKPARERNRELKSETESRRIATNPTVRHPMAPRNRDAIPKARRDVFHMRRASFLPRSIRPKFYPSKLIKENSHVSIQITPTCANSNADRTHHTDSIRGDGCWSRYCQRTTDATAARSANSSSTAATAASGQPATAIHTTTAADSAESTAVTACRGKRWPQYRDDSDDSNCSTDNRYVSQHVRAADKSDSGSPGSALRACHRFTHPKSHASAIRCCRS